MNTATIHGYARCSTNEKRQDIERQIKELKEAGATIIWQEYISGSAEYKPQQEKMFDATRPGDTVIVTEGSRLARKTKQMCEIIELAKEKHLKIVINNSFSIDCCQRDPDPLAVAFIQFAGIFSELESSILGERIKSGIALTKAKGKRCGRPSLRAEVLSKEFYQAYDEHKAGRMTISDMARKLNIARTTIYRYIDVVEREKELKEKVK